MSSIRNKRRDGEKPTEVVLVRLAVELSDLEEGLYVTHLARRRQTSLALLDPFRPFGCNDDSGGRDQLALR